MIFLIRVILKATRKQMKTLCSDFFLKKSKAKKKHIKLGGFPVHKTGHI